MNFLPLCTASVCPTISGVTVERRDHVLCTRFSRDSFMRAIAFMRCVSTHGPFFTERGIFSSSLELSLAPYLVRRLTMNLSVRLLLRVLYPRVGLPHGVTGLRPPEVLPSPPPCGWSTGFIATPRTVGRLPIQRERPALPIETFSCSTLPTGPTVAMQSTETSRISPEGRRSCAVPA